MFLRGILWKLVERFDKTNKSEKRRLNNSAVPFSADNNLSVNYLDKGTAAAIVPKYPHNFDSGPKHRVMEAWNIPDTVDMDRPWFR